MGNGEVGNGYVGNGHVDPNRREAVCTLLLHAASTVTISDQLTPGKGKHADVTSPDP